MHFKFPGNFQPILRNESIVSLLAKTTFFSKRSQPLARFSPRREVFVSDLCQYIAHFLTSDQLKDVTTASNRS